MKVLFINQSRNLGGAEKLLARIVENIGLDSVVAYGSKQFIGELKNNGRIIAYKSKFLGKINRRQNRFWLLFFILTIFGPIIEIINIINKERVDVVHANNYTSVIYALFPSMLLRIPLIWHCHETIDHSWIERKLKIFLSHFVNAIIVVSNNVKNHLVSGGVEPRKIVVVYNGISFDEAPLDHQKISKIIGVDASYDIVKMVTAVATFTENKGVHNVIKALAKIKEADPDLLGKIRFYVLGNRENNINHYVEHLDSLITENGLEGVVFFLGWVSNTLEVIRNVDICIVPSVHHEAFSLIAAEAMVASKIVIASRTGGLSEVVIDKFNGFSFEASDIDGLANLIRYCVKNIASLGEIRQHAYESATKRFTMDRMISKIKVVYQSVLAK